ncbi:hypothetical protein CLAFUR4_09790 [Fulvia fulva]|nr:hypothetical protein CLAFUR4_09790 [Fulvia fulva]
MLPPLPAGDWNDAYITRNDESGEPYFQKVVRTQIPGVESSWHAETFEYLSLKLGSKLRTNVYEAQLPGSSHTVVAKFARFSWEVGYLDKECAAYQWIEGKSIGPSFLGNISEEGRTIGFVLEHIAGAHHASPTDHAACKQVLSELHQLGIVHGDVNKHNFLAVDNRAVLIDFDGAYRTQDKQAFEKQMQSLEMQLAEASGRGGVSTVDS